MATTLLVLVGLVAVPSPVSAQSSQCVPPANDIVRDVPWSQRRLAPQLAWQLDTGSSALVGVVDTGVSAAAPTLAGRVRPGADLLSSGSANNDCAGRGTFMAALIAAKQTTGVGFAGIAPNAEILPIRVAEKANEVDPAKLASGIRLAVDGGAKVVAVSLATPVPTAELRSAVEYAAARDVLIIAAADIDMQNGQTPYPAAFSSVLAVSGIDETGAPIRKSDTPSPVTPSLVAPGSNVLSVGPSGSGHLTASGGGIGVAFVAGTAALVRSYRPTLTAAEVRHRLLTTADHPGSTLPDRALGFGVVDPYAALSTLLPEESGDKPLAEPVPPLRLPPVPVIDHRPVQIALTLAFLMIGALVVGGLAAAVIRRGRNRGWRSAWTAEASQAQTTNSPEQKQEAVAKPDEQDARIGQSDLSPHAVAPAPGAAAQERPSYATGANPRDA
ncbi:type VII secretion-associated serine protease mycosin [Saccharopolyspora spinosa]|uniref:type VII secretion-associated serine protease mycosin n=1 Tax=Saccharopolyspora spinosa TaxID=60894 RepID=UPI00376F2478